MFAFRTISKATGHSRLCRDLDVGDGYCLTNNSEQRLNCELSYPSVTQSADGCLHLAYTYHRQANKYLPVPRDGLDDRRS